MNASDGVTDAIGKHAESAFRSLTLWNAGRAV